jgi:propane monooxygenase coupling protein
MRSPSFNSEHQEIEMLQEHQDNIFKAMKDIKFEDTVSFQCGVTMNDSVEARAIATVMARHPKTIVTYMPAMIRIDGDGKMIFKMDEISEELGRVMTPHLFEISTSTHYGRMVMTDDNTVICFGDMNEMMEYIV